jgi:hypothetical protein
MGPEGIGLAQKADRVLVCNRGSGDVRCVGRERLKPLLEGMGIDPAPDLKKIILSAGKGNGAHQQNGANLVFYQPEQIETIWKETQKKGQDSLYPPLTPRETGDYFARLACAHSEESCQKTIIELDGRVGEWRKKEDSHSVRYLDNLINAVKSEARIARKHRGDLDYQLALLEDRLQIGISRAVSSADEGIKLSDGRLNKKLEKFEPRLDWFDARTLVRYVAPSVLTAGLAVYEAITKWMGTLGFWPKAGVIAGATALLGTALVGFRKFTKKLISKIEGKAAAERKAYADEGDKKQLELHDEFRKKEHEISSRWDEYVRRRTVEVIVRCFDIAIDFFPLYVTNEMRSFGVEWKEGFEGESRKQAIKIIEAGLKKQTPFAQMEPMA